MKKLSRDKTEDYINNINNFYSYLKINRRLINKDKDYKNLDSRISRIFENLKRKISRFINKIAGDKKDYSEKMAKNLIKSFIKEKELHNDENIGKVKKLYSYLKQLSGSNFSRDDNINFYEIGIKDVEKKKRCEPIVGLKAPSLKLLFHGTADEFGHSSNLEGSASARTSVDYLKQFFAKKEKNNPSPYGLNPSVIKQLDQCSKILQESSKDKRARLIQETIAKNLKTGAPCLISGGFTADWSDLGHEICFEIIPQKDRTVNFRIYNSGFGLEHHSKTKIGNKDKYIYTEWTGITQKKITSYSFSSTVANLYSDTPAYLKNIYHGIKNILMPNGETSFEDDEAHPNSHFMSPQRAGVCSWKAYMSFLRTKMDLETYKRFKADIKIQMVLDYVDQVGKKKLTQTELNLLQRGYEKLNRNLVQLHADKMIDDLYLRGAEKYLKKVNQLLELQEKYKLGNKSLPDFEKLPYIPSGNQLSSTIPSYTTSIASEKNNTSTIQTLSKKSFAKDIHDIYQMKSPPFDANIDIQSSNLKKIEDQLKKIVRMGQSCFEKGDSDLQLQAALIHYIKQLPLDGWRDQNDEKGLVCLLNGISTLLFKTSFTVPSPEKIPAERIYALKKILFIQCSLTSLTARWPYSLSIKNNAFTGIILDPHIQNELSVINKSMQSRPSESGSLISGYYSKYNLGDYPLAKLIHDELKKMDPSGSALKKALDFSYKERRMMSDADNPQAIEACKLEHSSTLPLWIHAMRETGLQINWIAKGRLEINQFINRKSDFNFNFSSSFDKKCIKSSQRYHYKGKGDIALNCVKKSAYLGYYSYDIVDNWNAINIFSHRPFKDPKLKPLLKSIIDYRITSEHIFFSRESLEKKLLNSRKFNEELRSLHSVGHYENLQLNELLTHFTKYQGSLNDTDYQTIFNIFLFKPGILNENNLLLVVEKLEKWIKDADETSQLQTLIFLRTTLLHLEPFAKRFNIDKAPLSSSMEALKDMLNDNRLANIHKSLIYAELIAHFNLKDSFNGNDVKLILLGKAFIAKHPVPDDWNVPQTSSAVDEVLLKQANAVRSYLEQHPDFVGEIYQTVHDADENSTWLFKKDHHAFYFENESKSISFNPLSGQFLGHKISRTTLLPFAITENFLFRSLFSDIKEANLEDNGSFSFVHKGLKFYVKMNEDINNPIVIEKQDGNGGVFKLVPNEKFLNKNAINNYKNTYYWNKTSLLFNLKLLIYINNPAKMQEIKAENDKKFYEDTLEKISQIDLDPILSRFLVEEHTMWQSLQNPDVIYLDDQSFEQKYKIKISRNSVEKIERVKDGLVLGRPHAFLSLFEHPIYTHEWYSNGKLKEIELPRFSLEFHLNDQTKKLESRDFPGFYLSNNQKAPSLGSFSQYIVLENTQGEKKVLIPNQSFLKVDKRISKKSYKPVDVLDPKFKLDQKAELHESLKESFFVYDLKPDGSMNSLNIHANIHLSYVLLMFKEYKQAEKHIKIASEKLSSFSQDEIKDLELISSLSTTSEDISANATATSLYAELILTKNNILYSKEEYKNKLALLYDKYLNLYNQITICKLSKEDELCLLNIIKSEPLSAAARNRLKELDLSEYKKYGTAYPKTHVNPHLDQDLAQNASVDFSTTTPKAPDFEDYRRLDLKKLTPVNTCNFLKSHFYKLYDLAISGSKKYKHMLSTGLKFGAPSLTSDDEKAYATILYTVLSNPENYKNNHYPKYMLDRCDWFKKLSSNITLSKRAKKLFYCQQKQPVELPERTPDNFALDKPQQLTDVSYDISKINKLAALSKKIGFRLNKKDSTVPPKTLDEMLEWIESKKEGLKDDVLAQGELNLLLEDIKKRKTATLTSYEISNKIIDNIQDKITALAQTEQSNLKKLEDQINSSANKLDRSSKSTVIKMLKKGDILNDVTLNEILISFARKDPKKLLKINPLLKQKDIDALYKLVGKYLQKSVRLNQMKRVLTLIENFKGATDDKEDFKNEIANEFMLKCQYNVIDHPEYLVFEHFSGISMRPSQIDKLDLFLKNGDTNIVMEMIMGSGKSKVLLPLLGLLRADGKKLSMMVVPEPLFESIASDTQKTLNQTFQQSLKTLHFDRNTQFTARSLELLYDTIKACIDKKKSLIVTSKSIQCFILKFIDAYSSGVNDENLVKIELMSKILRLLGSQALPNLDEIDTLLNSMKEVNFSMGKEMSAPPYEADLISEIYKLLYTHPKIKALGNLESDRSPTPNLLLITDDDYNKKIKPKLAESLLEKLQTCSFTDTSVTIEIRNLFKTIQQEQLELLECFLTRDEKRFKEAAAYVSELDKDVQNILALASGEIGSLLASCLTKNCNEKYGLDKQDGVLAIPYSSANTPSIGSEFSSRYVTMNYTIQYYVKNGVPTETIKNKLDYFKAKIIKERKNFPGKSNNEIFAWQEAQKFLSGSDFDLFNYTKNDLINFANKINSDASKVIDIVKQTFIPKIKYYDKKISCNAINLVSLFKQITGFTGTLWNSPSMHREVETVPEAGIAAKTLEILWKNSAEAVHVIDEKTNDEMLEQINLLGVSFDLISDSGGYFKKCNNLEMATICAKKYKKPCVFYDENNRQMITDGNTSELLLDSNIKEENRITFLDQSHTTGSDVKQKRDAVGIVTISSSMLLRDLAQSVWRLRGLDKSQKVKFVITKDIKNLIKHKLHLKDTAPVHFKEILLFSLMNQSSELSKHTTLSFRQQLDDVLQNLLLEILLGDYDEEQKQLAFNQMQHLWIKPADISPIDMYGRDNSEVEKDTFLKDSINAAKDRLNILCEKLDFLNNEEKHEMFKQLDAIGKHIFPHLPARIASPAQNNDEVSEVQKEVEKDVKKELDVEIETEREQVQLDGRESLCVKPISGPSDLANCYFENAFKLPKGKLGVFSFESYFSYRKQHDKLRPLLEGLHLTLNVLKLKDESSWQRKIINSTDNTELFGLRRTPFVHLFKHGNQGFTVLSQYEANVLAKHENSVKNCVNLYLYQPQTEEEIRRITMLKLLSGESTFSAPELNFIKSIFDNGCGISKADLRDFFENYALDGQPEKLIEYRSSSLREILES